MALTGTEYWSDQHYQLFWNDCVHIATSLKLWRLFISSVKLPDGFTHGSLISHWQATSGGAKNTLICPGTWWTQVISADLPDTWLFQASHPSQFWSQFCSMFSIAFRWFLVNIGQNQGVNQSQSEVTPPPHPQQSKHCLNVHYARAQAILSFTTAPAGIWRGRIWGSKSQQGIQIRFNSTPPETVTCILSVLKYEKNDLASVK